MNVSMFKTKRFIYNIIEKNILNKPGCSCIVGSRRIGKTVLLLQLEENNRDSTVYIDGTTFKEGTDFKCLYDKFISEGKKNILIDEVGKINDDLLGSFMSATIKYAEEKLCFIITGDVTASVNCINDSICMGGEYYELPPIMYIEYLCWSSGILNVTVEDVKKLTNYDKYIEYIKDQNIGTDTEYLDYIKNVVSDTSEVYLRATSLGDHMLEVPIKEIYDAIKYISICQFVYKNNSGDFISESALSKDVQEILDNEYNKEKGRWALSRNVIDYVSCLLYGCSLARKTWGYNQWKNLNIENFSLADNRVGACIFEYPWLSSLYLSSLTKNNNSFLDLWIKNSILLREDYIYPFCDKFKNNDMDEMNEIDTIYKLEHGNIHGLGVKNIKCDNVQKEYLYKVKQLSKDIGLENIYLTCMDDPKGSLADIYLRLDKVAASMELEYMSLMDEGEIYSCLSADQLVDKYFGKRK